MDNEPWLRDRRDGAAGIELVRSRLLLFERRTDARACSSAFKRRLTAWRSEVDSATEAELLARLFREFVVGTAAKDGSHSFRRCKLSALVFALRHRCLRRCCCQATRPHAADCVRARLGCSHARSDVDELREEILDTISDEGGEYCGETEETDIERLEALVLSYHQLNFKAQPKKRKATGSRLVGDFVAVSWEGGCIPSRLTPEEVSLRSARAPLLPSALCSARSPLLPFALFHVS